MENNEGDSARNNTIYNSEDEWTRDYMNKGIDKQKLIQHLYQKGFEYVLIQEIISRNL